MIGLLIIIRQITNDKAKKAKKTLLITNKYVVLAYVLNYSCMLKLALFLIVAKNSTAKLLKILRSQLKTWMFKEKFSANDCNHADQVCLSILALAVLDVKCSLQFGHE